VNGSGGEPVEEGECEAVARQISETEALVVKHVANIHAAWGRAPGS